MPQNFHLNHYRYLNENKIKLVTVGMFPKLDTLLQLSLGHNQITTIEQDAFDFPKLQHL